MGELAAALGRRCRRRHWWCRRRCTAGSKLCICRFPSAAGGLTLPGLCDTVGCTMEEAAATLQQAGPSAAHQ